MTWTWATSGTRRRVRVAAAAAGLAGALVLTACSDGGGSDDKASATPTTPTASASADTGGGSGSGGSDGSTAAAGKLAGSWVTTSDGKIVALVVNGSEAGLFATGGSVCSGTAGADTIRLTCGDGNKDRADGTVGSVSGTSLKVTWKSGLGTETYTKAEGGSLPSGLPTASLGS
ncbi:membrane protein [Streptomyces lincolnensis]|uniref:Membrane protein n=1 Tax=Streptomyces lincolnensis TaxID=1915 RepID=A0A1B1MEM1_STRLN|nr:hypothetical protein [Streptomyces lincolnensis]ANS66957.1 membrane protein [Streptomyces lincolnensis]AXG55829.1 membrane protein [Streptomyces lincolnensis]QMV07688.1 hypothetical protein GJU35_19740 [Streptomyces lincolnensis]